MQDNKHIERDSESGTNIYNRRNLTTDYRTLPPLLKPGMRVLDIGCGTGAISKDIARIVGPTGKVIGIDNTEKFIVHGRERYHEVGNMELLHADLFAFEPPEALDLIVSARTFQWLSKPQAALARIKQWLKRGGQLSILDYNHEALEWEPSPPTSMQTFYQAFLKWKSDAGMNNRIADDLAGMMEEAGFQSVQVFNSDEYYDRTREDFSPKVGIWSKVAGLMQIVEEGYIDEVSRVQAIREYDHWVEHEAVSMTMKLNEVRGVNNAT